MIRRIFDETINCAYLALRGQTVEIYGQGLYRYDTLFIGAGFKAQDTVTLLLGIPLLVLTTLLYQRRSLRGGILLMGMLGYFLYIYASMALGAAYNGLFLIYIALFSTSLFAFVLAFTALDIQTISTRFATGMPRRGLIVFMFVSGLLTLTVWSAPLMTALLQGQPPKLLDSYTTKITDVLDLGIIVPAVFLSGGLLLRRNPLGYLIAVPLLVLIVMLAPMIVLSTTNQLAAGLSFTPGEIVGPIAGFLVLGLMAIWLLVLLLRNLAPAAPQNRVAQPQAVLR
ncbi:MAG: hypothetical protein NT075_08480 [Chloroflexi bacterium]|nr:hypothetical protein [Chloroflexota bacterium]